MHIFSLLILILILTFSCSAERPADTGRQKPSDTSGPVSQSPAPTDFSAPSPQANVLVQEKESELPAGIATTKNTPPEISRLKFMPEVFKPGDSLYLEAEAKDADGDPVSILYEWAKNNEPAGNTEKLAAQIKRGDRISVKVTPFDGKEYGRPVVLQREIRNMPPVIIEEKQHRLEGSLFTYQVKASDPDGDSLAYSIKTGPPGMLIDPKTGLVQWKVPPDFKGKAPFTVSVSDGHSGEAIQSLTFTLRHEPEK